MAEERKSWLRRRVEAGVSKGLNRAYTTVRVDPDKFLLQLRAGYRVPISGYHGVFSLEIHELDVVAESIIRALGDAEPAVRRTAALERRKAG